MPLFKKKDHQTFFMLGLLIVAPILYYRYRNDLLDFQRKNLMRNPVKKKEAEAEAQKN